jgi:hypothetical protein
VTLSARYVWTKRRNRMKEQTQNIALRLVALLAAIPMVWLCKELSPRPQVILLSLTFYAAPNIAIAICPINWERFQIGVGIGYPLSMIVALQIYLHASSGLMPTIPPTPPPVAAYRAALLLDVALLLTSIAVLIWRRRRLRDLFGVTLSFVGGLVYPFLAFVLIAVLDQV